MTASAVDLAAQRRFFAEEVQLTSNIRTPELVEALATVPREAFLGPGPWTIRGEADFQGPMRQTPGDDPRFVYHNLAIALDESRTLFNGAPGVLAVSIEALGIRRGVRVAHIGTGAGYYTAVMAETVGSAGRVTGIEVDASLAARAAGALKPWPWANVTQGDGRELPDGPFDAVFVNAGVTHIHRAWIDALAPGGRILAPISATMAGPMGPAMANIAKGLMLLVTRDGDTREYAARLVTFVGIYAAIGLRDDALNRKIGAALAKMPFPPIRRFRTDAHAPSDSCWLHDDATGCWSMLF